MRVLFTTPDYPPMSGGIQILCERLVRCSRLSYDVVTLSAPRGSTDRVAAPPATRTPRFGDHRVSVGVLNAATLKRALTSRYDAVLSGHIVTGPAALAVQRVFGTPAVQYLHAAELADRPKLARAVTRRASASIAVSSYTREQTIALGAPAERVHVIHPGVDPLDVARRASSSDADGQRPTVLTVARLEDRYKGFDVMIRALALLAARVPDVQWVLVGEGSLRGELEAMAGAAGVANRITFAGAVEDEVRDEWLERADVFAMPSRLMPGEVGGEGFGIVYLEAGAYGLPCVAGNVGGSTDAVIDGETGLLVDPTDHVAVADALARLLLDAPLRERLGEAGRARAQRLTWSHMAQQVDDLIERLVSAAGR